MTRKQGKSLSARSSARADRRLSTWGDCRGQGELFTRRDLSKAEPARVKRGK